MLSNGALLALSLLPLSATAETVLGVYMMHRHGDRTDKQHTPANLTDLGYNQVYNSGQYYRSRYVELGAQSPISGMNANIVKQSQIQATSSSDTVLQNSAMGFLQGLYPPAGETVVGQTLANGSTIGAPMNGYQLIPISVLSTGSGSESTGWLQSATACNNAIISSNNYYYSPEYTTLLNGTSAFYQSILPVINTTFTASQDSYKNAYIIYDLLNVAEIHNQSIPNNDLITDETFHQLQTLADTHEYNLAYNASSTIRAIQGMVLAGQALSFLNNTVTSSGANKFGIQFGAYGTFQSFFGLANLTAADPMFYGIPGYASALTFELFTDANYTGNFPATTDLQVRMLWHNGTTTSGDDLTPTAYPMFGQSEIALPWSTFYSNMIDISVITNNDWCVACGNTTGTCAGVTSSSTSTTPAASSGAATAPSTGSKSGMSNAVAGVIGAMVTLGLIFAVEAAILLVGGFRLVSKKRLAAHTDNDATPVNVGPSKGM